MPIRVLEEETGLNVAGLDKFDLNADLAVEEGENSLLNHKGAFRSPGLGVLAYEFSTPSTPTSALTMMATKISGFRLDYADSGLVARACVGHCSQCPGCHVRIENCGRSFLLPTFFAE